MNDESQNNSNVLPFARDASQGFDELEKFRSGTQEVHGPRGNILARSVAKYVDGIKAIVEKGVTELEKGFDLVEWQDDPEGYADPERSPTTRSEDGKVLYLGVKPREEQATLRQRIDRLVDLLRHEGYDRFVNEYRGLFYRSPLLAPALRGFAASTAGFVAAGAFGADLPQSIFAGLAAASAAVGVYSIHHGRQLQIQIGSDTAKHPLLLEDKPGGSMEGSGWAFPSPRFLELAGMAMTANIGNEAEAKRCMQALVREYAFRTGAGQGIRLEVEGVSLDTSTGDYAISLKDASFDGGSHTIARERGGTLIEVDPNACMELRQVEQIFASAPHH